MVDLAGSERIKSMNVNNNELFKENIEINKSLTVLGKIIKQLAEPQNSDVKLHIPYRESKLT